MNRERRIIPPDLIALAQKNSRTMRTLGIPPDNPSQASELFCQRRFTGLVNNPEFSLAPRSDEPLDNIDKLMNGIANHNAAMMLVRPDMYHHREAFITFLLDNGFVPSYVTDVKISEPAYEQMYFDVFKRPAAAPALPNRTLIYTDAPATLIVFSDPQKRYGEARLADRFFDEFKGRPGVPDGKTLRGKVVFDEAVRLGYDILDDPTIAQAVDPLGAYREAVKSEDGPHGHLPKDYQLLNYTGVGVHVPNSEEMRHDLPLICDVKQLEEIDSHLKYPYIDLYNWLWMEGVPLRPLVITLGGYAGTTKSSLVSRISNRLPPHLNVATPHLRSMLKNFIPEEVNPWLYAHTYRLDSVSSDTGLTDPVYGFLRQIEPVADSIQQLMQFIGTERQHHIIEGNHVFPGKVSFPPNVVGVELYLKVSDPLLHREMMVGPTHRREVTEHEFEIGRTLHNYTVAEAERLGKPIFEYNEGYDGLLGLLNDRLRNEINSTLLPQTNSSRLIDNI